MKLSEQYAAEFNPGGNNKCVRHNNWCHTGKCSFCVRDELLAAGVTNKTLSQVSAKLRKAMINTQEAIEAIDKELEK
jgi:hypothetical protein